MNEFKTTSIQESSGRIPIDQCIKRSTYVFSSYQNNHFKGAIKLDFCGRYEAEYISTGVIGVEGKTREEVLKKLVERLRADADFIEQKMNDLQV